MNPIKNTAYSSQKTDHNEAVRSSDGTDSTTRTPSKRCCISSSRRYRNTNSSALTNYASWGYFDPGENNYYDSYQSPPVNWSINTERKQRFFNKIKEITGIRTSDL